MADNQATPTPTSNKPQVHYHPAPSIGHEIGVMLGFMGFFVLAMGVYYTLWKAGNMRAEKKERERREALTQKGFGIEKSAESVRGYN